MGIYEHFSDLENATILVKSKGDPVIDSDTRQPVYTETTVYNNVGIYYEVSANEQSAREQIQDITTSQVLLNPEKVTTQITDKMDLYVTTDSLTNKKYRIVTVKNPLNINEAIIIDLQED